MQEEKLGALPGPVLPRPQAESCSTSCCFASVLQIAALLKDNERIQSTQTVTTNDDDSDIKKIKKVGAIVQPALLRARGGQCHWGRPHSCACSPISP